VLAATVIVVALLIAATAWLARPHQVATLVLHQAGVALGLEIRFSGAAEYRLRGTPHLMVRDLEARRPGAERPLLTARRAYLALPWSTLRSRGTDLTVERIELDAPHLDLAALQEWLASRPPGDGARIPVLTRGIRITGGSVEGGDWHLRRLGVDLPRLHPGRRVSGRVTGELLAAEIRLPFDLQVLLAEPAPDAALGLAGIATLVTASWSLPMQPVLSARLHAGDDGYGLDGMRLGMRARYHAPAQEPLHFTAGLAAPVRYLDGRVALARLTLVLRGDGIVPDLRARGRFAWEEGIELELDGALQHWPRRWPALPRPLDTVDSPLPFALGYTGAADFSGLAQLRLQHGPARLDSRFRLPEVLDWFERLPAGTPVPPLEGHLSLPRLEVAGARLHGVEVAVSPEAAEP